MNSKWVEYIRKINFLQDEALEMADIVEKAKRSEMMRNIRSKNTKPEKIVRQELHRAGLRFRLHRKDLPGSPDIVLPRWKTVVLVHGCYWHRHEGCKLAYPVKSNIEKWNRKFNANINRDRKTYGELKHADWRVIVIWECATRSFQRGQIGNIVHALLEKQTEFSEVSGDKTKNF